MIVDLGSERPSLLDGAVNGSSLIVLPLVPKATYDKRRERNDRRDG